MACLRLQRRTQVTHEDENDRHEGKDGTEAKHSQGKDQNNQQEHGEVLCIAFHLNSLVGLQLLGLDGERAKPAQVFRDPLSVILC